MRRRAFVGRLRALKIHSDLTLGSKLFVFGFKSFIKAVKLENTMYTLYIPITQPKNLGSMQLRIRNTEKINTLFDTREATNTKFAEELPVPTYLALSTTEYPACYKPGSLELGILQGSGSINWRALIGQQVD